MYDAFPRRIRSSFMMRENGTDHCSVVDKVSLPWRPDFDFARNLIWCCNFIIIWVFLCFCNTEIKSFGNYCLFDRRKAKKIKSCPPFFAPQSLKDCLFILNLPDSINVFYPIWIRRQQFPLNSCYKYTWLHIPKDCVIDLGTFRFAVSLYTFTQEITNIENTECTISYVAAYVTIFARIM
jgi:hypothetical protein